MSENQYRLNSCKLANGGAEGEKQKKYHRFQPMTLFYILYPLNESHREKWKRIKSICFHKPVPRMKGNDFDFIYYNRVQSNMSSRCYLLNQKAD
jgi:hypothetical protein